MLKVLCLLAIGFAAVGCTSPDDSGRHGPRSNPPGDPKPGDPKPGDPKPGTNLVAPPGQVAIDIVQSRQIQVGSVRSKLQISVALANGAGSSAIRLNPMTFSVKTTNGILISPDIAADGSGGSAPPPSVEPPGSEGDPLNIGNEEFVVGMVPNPSTSLAGGYTTVLKIFFDLKGQTPGTLIFNEFGAQVGGAAGAGRQAEVTVTVEECAKCAARSVNYCTYTDVDNQNCGACGRSARGHACEAGKPVCHQGETLISNGAFDYCSNRNIDPLHCGARDLKCSDALVGGQHHVCMEGTCAAGFAVTPPTTEDPLTCALRCGQSSLDCEPHFVWDRDFHVGGLRVNSDRGHQVEVYSCDQDTRDFSVQGRSMDCACRTR
jgi:hypothetical protein